MRRSVPPLLLGLLALTGCELPRAMGEANAIIIAADPDRWETLRPIVEGGLEPTIRAVADERPFRLTYQDPGVPEHWGQLQRFRQVLVIGTPDDPWIEPVLAARRGSDAPPVPGIVQVQNVWSRGQLVSALILPEEISQEEVVRLVDELRDILDRDFRGWVDQRMFISGRDSILADSLRQNVGFSLLLPNVYRHSARDSVFRFRNDNPSPSERIREVAVTWVVPIPEEFPTQEELEAWRPEFTRAVYNDPQDLELNLVSFGPVTVAGREGIEFQSAWVSAPGAWPAGGPFITRVVPCPEQNRLYYLDAWLYAPGQLKYEFMIQLQTILDSFRCG